MDHYQTIAHKFQLTIEGIAASVDLLERPLEQAAGAMTAALLAEGKVLACGTGPDGALAQLLVCRLLSCYDQERPALPALSLAGDTSSFTALASSEGLAEGFSRQVRALGQPGDVLVCIHSGGDRSCLIRAVSAAHQREMTVVTLSNAGRAQPEGDPQFAPGDIQLRLAVGKRSLAIEIHTMAINSLCDLIDQNLFGTAPS